MLGRGQLPELQLWGLRAGGAEAGGGGLTCSNQPKHPPSGVGRTAMC